MLQSSHWFLTSLMAVAGMLLALVMLALDQTDAIKVWRAKLDLPKEVQKVPMGYQTEAILESRDALSQSGNRQLIETHYCQVLTTLEIRRNWTH